MILVAGSRCCSINSSIDSPMLSSRGWSSRHVSKFQRMSGLGVANSMVIAWSCWLIALVTYCLAQINERRHDCARLRGGESKGIQRRSRKCSTSGDGGEATSTLVRLNLLLAICQLRSVPIEDASSANYLVCGVLQCIPSRRFYLQGILFNVA